MKATAQVNAHIPETLWRPFKAMLALRGQTYTEWLRDHMQVALREEERRRQLTASAMQRPA